MPSTPATDPRRAAFISICRSWIGTPYRFRAHVKGVGSDCATWLSESLITAGIATRESLYGGLNINHPDWWQSTTDDVYRRRLMRHARAVMEASCRLSTEILPGCVLLQHAARSRVSNHSGVVTAWPMIIHCLTDGVVEVDATRVPMWGGKAVAVYDPFFDADRYLKAKA
jgi:hypothetical protein